MIPFRRFGFRGRWLPWATQVAQVITAKCDGQELAFFFSLPLLLSTNEKQVSPRLLLVKTDWGKFLHV